MSDEFHECENPCEEHPGEEHENCDWCNAMLDSFLETTGVDLREVAS